MNKIKITKGYLVNTWEIRPTEGLIMEIPLSHWSDPNNIEVEYYFSSNNGLSYAKTYKSKIFYEALKAGAAAQYEKKSYTEYLIKEYKDKLHKLKDLGIDIKTL